MPTLALRSGSLLLEGHLVTSPSARAVLVLLHGIPGGPPPPDDPGYAGLAESLASRGYAVLHFDMRGVRGSAGDFSFGGWQQDAHAALDAVDPLGLPKVLVGSSAGGSVAIATAAGRADVAAVATLAAVASFDILGGDIDGALARFRNLGIIHDPAFPSDPDAWWKEFVSGSAELLAPRLAPRPLLVVHGDADQVVPYPHAERIFAAAREPKELVRIPGGAHQLRREPAAFDALTDWLDHLAL
jgi:fermentation-respiration switch protein FrsA (DUF1100 family)